MRFVHTHCIIPTFGERQAIYTTIITTTEINSNGTILIGRSGDVVVAVYTPIILFDITFRVINSDRPECLYWREFPFFERQGVVIL